MDNGLLSISADANGNSLPLIDFILFIELSSIHIVQTVKTPIQWQKLLQNSTEKTSRFFIGRTIYTNATIIILFHHISLVC